MFIDSNQATDRISRTKLPERAPLTGNRAGDRRGKSGNSGNSRDDFERGRREGDTEIPEQIRATIGAVSRLGSGIKDTAKAFGVSPTVVQFAKYGSKTGDYKADESLVNKIEDILSPVRNKAIDRLTQTFQEMTDDKLRVCKGGELSKIAANLSAVLKNLTLPESGNTNATQVIIHAASHKNESDYPAVEVN